MFVLPNFFAIVRCLVLLASAQAFPSKTVAAATIDLMPASAGTRGDEAPVAELVLIRSGGEAIARHRPPIMMDQLPATPKPAAVKAPATVNPSEPSFLIALPRKTVPAGLLGRGHHHGASPMAALFGGGSSAAGHQNLQNPATNDVEALLKRVLSKVYRTNGRIEATVRQSLDSPQGRVFEVQDPQPAGNGGTPKSSVDENKDLAKSAGSISARLKEAIRREQRERFPDAPHLRFESNEEPVDLFSPPGSPDPNGLQELLKTERAKGRVPIIIPIFIPVSVPAVEDVRNKQQAPVTEGAELTSSTITLSSSTQETPTTVTTATTSTEPSTKRVVIAKNSVIGSVSKEGIVAPNIPHLPRPLMSAEPDNTGRGVTISTGSPSAMQQVRQYAPMVDREQSVTRPSSAEVDVPEPATDDQQRTRIAAGTAFGGGNGSSLPRISENGVQSDPGKAGNTDKINTGNAFFMKQVSEPQKVHDDEPSAQAAAAPSRNKVWNPVLVYSTTPIAHSTPISSTVANSPQSDLETLNEHRQRDLMLMNTLISSTPPATARESNDNQQANTTPTPGTTLADVPSVQESMAHLAQNGSVALYSLGFVPPLANSI